MKKILKWILIIFGILFFIGIIAGGSNKSNVGKYAYNKSNDVYLGKIIELKPCGNKPSINCYIADFGNLHNQYSGSRPLEYPIDIVDVKDDMSNPKEDLKYIYGSEYCILEDCFLILSGIERDKNSNAFGELVVPEINLWENTGLNRGKVVGKIKHNTKVQILNKKETDQLYYLVKFDNLTGWVSELFVVIE
jgi:hypothetical protein